MAALKSNMLGGSIKDEFNAFSLFGVSFGTSHAYGQAGSILTKGSSSHSKMKIESREARLGFKLLAARADQMNSDHPAVTVVAVAVVVGPLLHTTLQHNSDSHHKQHKGQPHRFHPAVLVVVDNFGFDPVGHNMTVAAAAEVVSIGHCMNHHEVALGVDSSVPMVMLGWSYPNVGSVMGHTTASIFS